MMEHLRRWGQLARIRCRRAPFVGRLAIDVQESFWAGAIVGIIAGAVMTAVLGLVNRGWIGAAVGGISGAALGLIIGGIVGIIGALWHATERSQIDLAIRLERSQARFSPGETVSGSVELRTSNSLDIEEGTLYLVCRGFYIHDHSNGQAAGSGDQAVQRETHQYLAQALPLVPEGRISKGAVCRYPFDFELPQDALPTHHGWVCSIRWSLHMHLVSRANEPNLTQREIYVESEPPALAAPHRVFATRIEGDLGHVLLTLPHVVCAEGEQIEAQIRLSPMASFAAEGVRAVLLRLENTPDGNDATTYVTGVDLEASSVQAERTPGGHGTTYVWIEDEDVVEAERVFSAADTVNYVAHLQAPAQWRPTFSTQQGNVRWKVGVIVASADLGQLRAFHEVVVHTGTPELRGILAPSARHGPEM